MKIFDRRSIRLKGYDYSQPGFYFVTICTDNRKSIFGNIFNGEMLLNNYGRIVEKYCQITENHFQNIKFDVFTIMPNHFHAIIKIIGTTITHDNPVGAGFPRPNTNKTNPNLNEPRPNTNKTNPNLNNPRPNTNKTNPNLNEPRPNTNKTNPNLNDPHPNTNKTNPNINNGCPIVNIRKQNIKNAYHDDEIVNDLFFPENKLVPNLFGRGDLTPSLGQIVGFFKYGVSKHINQIRKTPGIKLWQRNYYEHIIRNKNGYDRISKYIKNNPIKWDVDSFNTNNL